MIGRAGGSGLFRDNYWTSPSGGDASQMKNGTGFGAGTVRLERCWLYRDGSREGTDHHDGIQVPGTSGLTVSQCKIEGFNTSAMLIKADFGDIDSVRVEESLLTNATGTYGIYFYDVGGNELSNIVVKDCFIDNAVTNGPTFVESEAAKTNARQIVWENISLPNGDPYPIGDI